MPETFFGKVFEVLAFDFEGAPNGTGQHLIDGVANLLGSTWIDEQTEFVAAR